MGEEVEPQIRSRQLSRWRRIKQDVAPEQTWVHDLMREAGDDLRDSRQWLKRLNSANGLVRQQAQREIHHLPRMAQVLLTVQAYNLTQAHTVTVVLLTMLASVAALWVGVGVNAAHGVLWGLIVSSIIGAVAASHLVTSRTSETAKNLLDSCQDARLIPFLLMRLAYIHRNGHAPRQMTCGRNLRNALVRLLPYVQETDAADWTGMHWRHLLYYLRHPAMDVELTLAILQTMQRVGNEDAAKQMRVLTNLSPALNAKTSISKNRAAWESNKSLIEQTAAQCLPGLETRLEQQRQAQTLLRASGNAVVSASNTLLRPASALINETPAEQLLRPQNAE